MKIDHDLCSLCLDCVEVCPNGVIGCEDTNDRIAILNQEECIVCRQCEEVCVSKAIAFEGAYSQGDILQE